MNATIALLIALVGNLFYHLVMRTAPKDLGPFTFLGVAYLLAGIASLGIAGKYESLTVGSLARTLHPNTFAIAFAVLLIEAGYLIAYRHGAAIGTASLMVNATVAAALALIGWFIFRERVSAQAMIGIAVTFAGVLTLAFAKVPAAGQTH